MREIERIIASAVIFSQDGKVLMGRKDPNGGGVYTNCWHIPGGGADEGESLIDAVRREIKEEVGLDISEDIITPINEVGSGESIKRLKDTGEDVICHMEFNYFEVKLNEPAAEVSAGPSDDLVELRWFTRDELQDVDQIPGGREFFIKQGYMDK